MIDVRNSVGSTRHAWNRTPSNPVLQLVGESGGGGQVLAHEADRAHLETEPLAGLTKVIEHDIDDGHLVDARSVDLHHCFGVARLQLERIEVKMEEGKRGKER